MAAVTPASAVAPKSAEGQGRSSMRPSSRKYASSVEVGVFAEVCRDPRVIHPESTFAINWSAFLSLLIFYATIMIPLRIAFEIGRDTHAAVVWFDLCVDFLFCCDIFIQTRLAYRISSNVEEYEFSLSRIRSRYLKTWFLVDLIAAFPFDLLLILRASSGDNIIVTKLLKTLRLARVAKLVKLSKIKHLRKRMEDQLLFFSINPGVRRMLETLLLVFVISHMTACTWYFTAVSSSPNSWVDVFMPEEKMENNIWSLYVASMYWSVSTLTSVGFGDFEPQNNLERSFATITCWAGATVFGYVIGQMSSMVADLNQASFQFHRKMDSINSYLKYRKVPFDLQKRIRKFFRYYIGRKMLFDEQQILADLTHGLRVELSMFLTKDVLMNVHIFKGVENPSFMAAIVTMLKPFSAAPGDFIVRQGDVALEMYLVVRGTVEIISDDGFVFSRLNQGSHFGDIENLDSEIQERRAASVRAVTYCDLFSISKADVAEVSRRFPEVYEKIKEASEMRKAEARNLKTLSKAWRMTQGKIKSVVKTLPENPAGSISDYSKLQKKPYSTSHSPLSSSRSASVTVGNVYESMCSNHNHGGFHHLNTSRTAAIDNRLSKASPTIEEIENLEEGQHSPVSPQFDFSNATSEALRQDVAMLRDALTRQSREIDEILKTLKS